MIWAALLTAVLACYVIKLTGLVIPEHVLQRPGIQRAAGLLPAALLAALSVTQTFSRGTTLVVDARAAGLAAAIAALALRAPFLIVVLVATLTTAALRLAL
jgi:branched-subunit amino acid transport protein